MEYLQNFEGVDQVNLARSLIEKDEAYEVLKYFYKFDKVCNREVLLEIIAGGYARDVVSRIQTLDRDINQYEIAELLMTKGHAREFFDEGLDKYENVSKLLTVLIKKGFTKDIAEHLVGIKYRKANQKISPSVAYELLAAGYCGEVVYNSELFPELDMSRVADTLIENGEEDLFLRYPEKFSDIEAEKITTILKKLVATGEASSVGWSLDKFQGELSLEIADMLIQSGEGYNVARHVARFKDIDQAKIAQDLIAANQAYCVNLLPDFSQLNQAGILKDMIDSEQPPSVDGLKKYDHLGFDNALRLLKKGQILPVLFNLQKFRK